ncbi:MAG: hypothetical protein JJ978_09005 [Roseivirga sp.]|uniref:hypothetical protein n=1 Tax=Roseivirga sp. TaxID=1964215 RepID=UPI001B19278F|nr:hypothetical protein [Roseivirga sp.]MBO6495691.1 hypothetical protein [Roseivirga sp.]
MLTESPISTEGQMGIAVAEFKVNRIVSRWLKYVALESSRGHSPFFEKGAMGIRTKFSLQKLILQTYWVEQNFRDVHYMEAIFLKG